MQIQRKYSKVHRREQTGKNYTENLQKQQPEGGEPRRRPYDLNRATQAETDKQDKGPEKTTQK